MCCRWILSFLSRLQIAVYQGFIEYCQKGCIIGSQYLVKPNYHPSERLIWYVIFIVGSSLGFTLTLNYMYNYSRNVFRIVDEEYEGNELVYLSLGVCQMGVDNDEETLIRVENVLIGSLYQQFPILSSNDKLKHFVHMLTFQNLNRKNQFEHFLNYTKTLPPDLQEYLHNYDFNKLIKNIPSSCTEFFVNCHWLDKPFDCCAEFLQITTMLGKCFLFNSLHGENFGSKEEEKLRQLEIFKEPFRLHLNFTKAASIFILNVRDIPEIISPLPRFKTGEKGTTLSLEFNIVPIINDDGLTGLPPDTLGCEQSDFRPSRKGKIYGLRSHSTCITEWFFEEQKQSCNCVNINGPKLEAKFCNLSQLVCLEQNGFINPRSMPINLAEKCYPGCTDSEYVVETVYYSKNTEENLQKVFSLDFVFLNFPKSCRRRQAIRQAEDKLASFSNTLGLFMGLNVVNIIEFIYITCCAFWKYNETSATVQGVTKIQAHPQQLPTRPQEAAEEKGSRRTKTVTGSQIDFQP